MYSQLYDGQYYPSAPVATITIREPEKKNKGFTLTALIDSGVDATMIPLSAFKAVKAHRSGKRIMRGILGQTHEVDLYVIVVEIGSYIATGIQAIAVPDDSETIIGRDVLNQFIVTLNGPAEIFELKDL